MTKAPRRKPHIGKTERRSILRAAAKRKPKDEKPKKAEKGGKQKTPLKTPPWKADRPKRKPDPVSREAIPVRKPRGPDLKPRKRRSQTMTTAKTEGDDVKDNGDKDAKAAKAEADAKAKAKAEADAKAYADAEAKAKAEAKDAGVTWAAWPKYGSAPTEAEAKARADAEAAAKARAEAAGQPWTPWPKPVVQARNLLEPFALPEGEPPPAEDEVVVYDASSGRTKVMKVA